MNVQSRQFAVTSNQETPDDCWAVYYDCIEALNDDELAHFFNQVIFNFETGESGNDHLQIHIDCAASVRPTQIVRYLPALTDSHFEPVHDLAASRKYCRALDGEKSGDVWGHEEWCRPGYVERGSRGTGAARDRGPSQFDLLAERCADAAAAGDSWFKVRRELATTAGPAYARAARQLEDLHKALYKPAEAKGDLRPWQKMIVDRLATPADGRTITWIYDPVGNNGKSWLCNYLIRNHDAIMLDGRVQDMAYAYQGQKVVCMDIARGQSDNVDHLHVTAEKLASGCIFSSKYESTNKVYDEKPHLFIFANVRHKTELWTAGRCVEIDLPAWILAEQAGPLVAVAAAQAMRFM
ncbi:MAG: replicase [Cressdnaviricota sp.]|nr:MAG: replicase [Cressdnaviricota sp.]